MANYFVSISGRDFNSGKTLAKPFRTIAKGISVLQPGDFLNLRGGNYVESVVVNDKHGIESDPIVIRPYAGEHGTIDGSVSEFRQTGNEYWEPASLHEPNNPNLKDEYVSRKIFARDCRRHFP